MDRGKTSILEIVRLVPLVLLTIAMTPFAGSQSIQMTGYDLSIVKDEGTTPSNPFAGSVLLLDNPVRSRGTLFAFTALFRQSDPVTLQLFRNINSTTSYRLIAEFTIIPSVPKGREDIYIESFLNRRCIAVEPGDRLGLYVIGDPPVLQSNFNSSSQVIRYKTGQPLKVNDMITFDTIIFPMSIRVVGYIAVYGSPSSSSPSVEVNCTLGLMIPRGHEVPFSTTTIPLITGAPGAIGATGSMGATGATGERGSLGQNGVTGLNGSTGPTGMRGPTGPPGVVGVMGPKGFTGETGATGNQGLSERGDLGILGSKGSVGLMGSNYTFYLNWPTPLKGQLEEASDTNDPFWSSSRAIWATYIWLAIVSFLLLIVIIVIVVIGFLHKSASHPIQSPARSNHSRSNIMDDSRSNY